MKAREYRLIVLLCSVVGPTPAGGDILAVELARHWPADQPRPVVLTSVDGKFQLDQLGIGGFGVRLLHPPAPPSASPNAAPAPPTVQTPHRAPRAGRGYMHL